MIPVRQTILTAPGGNCFAACVASVLDAPLETVPHFFRECAAGDSMWTQGQWDEVRGFAEQRDLIAHWLDPEIEQAEVKALEQSGAYYVAFGPSPRTRLGHCVVMRQGAYVHDPMPGAEYFGGKAPWLYVFFVPTGASSGDRNVGA